MHHGFDVLDLKYVESMTITTQTSKYHHIFSPPPKIMAMHSPKNAKALP